MLCKLARQEPPALAFACARKLPKFIEGTLTALLCAASSIPSCSAVPEITAKKHAGEPVRMTVHQPKPEDEPNYVRPTLEYDEIIDPGKKRSMSAMIGAEFALRSNRVDRSIQLARRAMRQDPEDMDAHKALAEALDRKLEFQSEKDPAVFAECVKEYLVVMRNGVGLEKGTNFRGMGIFDYLYRDDEYYEVARKRLKHLTGYAPKPWESNEKYLKRVLQPAETELRGKILQKKN